MVKQTLFNYMLVIIAFSGPMLERNKSEGLFLWENEGESLFSCWSFVQFSVLSHGVYRSCILLLFRQHHY